MGHSSHWCLRPWRLRRSLCPAHDPSVGSRQGWGDEGRAEPFGWKRVEPAYTCPGSRSTALLWRRLYALACHRCADQSHRLVLGLLGRAGHRRPPGGSVCGPVAEEGGVGSGSGWWRGRRWVVQRAAASGGRIWRCRAAMAAVRAAVLSRRGPAAGEGGCRGAVGGARRVS